MFPTFPLAKQNNWTKLEGNHYGKMKATIKKEI
jgi:hypothetical protein